MKKIFYLVIFSAILSLTGLAQTEKGYMMVGADLASFHANDAGFQMVLNPSIAWFVKKDFALGGGITLGYGKPDDGDGHFIYGIAPLARLYFAGKEKNKFFGQLAAGFGGSTNGGGTYWHISPSVGYNYFLIRNVALELGAGYTYFDRKGQPGNGELMINFGLQVFLPTKKAK